MPFPFNNTTLPEPTEKELKTLMAVVMQNGLMIQQLQLMVVLKQKEMMEEKSGEEEQRQKEEEKRAEEGKQNKLKEEEVRTIRMWSEEKSQRYVERFRGYRGDKRCRKCNWFGHRAHQCRREEIEAERELRGGSEENRWQPLRCRVMMSDEEREAACSKRREAQQGAKCWGCGEVGHCLWTCPRKVAHPTKGKVQQERKVVYVACKGENHIARNCNSYWRWRERELREEIRKLRERREQELKEKVKELKKQKERSEGKERVVRCTMRPLKEVWMRIGMEKIDTHEGITVKALLDSGAMEMFVNKKFAEEQGFRMEKLEKPLVVTNVDGSSNSRGKITHEIECNVYYNGHQERIKFDVCNLGRTNMILGMPWLAAHNPEIDWEKGEVKMTRCPPWCGKNKEGKEKQEKVRRREVRTMEGEKAISWAADKKEDWGREEEMEINHRKIKTMVPKRLHWWLKVFGKVESERMPVRKV